MESFREIAVFVLVVGVGLFLGATLTIKFLFNKWPWSK
jgi:hypothetical protein